MFWMCCFSHIPLMWARYSLKENGLAEKAFVTSFFSDGLNARFLRLNNFIFMYFAVIKEPFSGWLIFIAKLCNVAEEIEEKIMVLRFVQESSRITKIIMHQTGQDLKCKKKSLTISLLVNILELLVSSTWCYRASDVYDFPSMFTYGTKVILWQRAFFAPYSLEYGKENFPFR